MTGNTLSPFLCKLYRQSGHAVITSSAPFSFALVSTFLLFCLEQQSSGITWVQGENSAKSYPVAAGQSILLMDSESPVMYIKSTDQSGVPLPLRIFDYKERSQSTSNAQTQKIDYISRNEFETFRNEIQGQSDPLTFHLGCGSSHLLQIESHHP